MSKDRKDENFFKRNKGKLVGAAVGIGAGVVALPLTLGFLGFGAAGVAGGSIAAGIQFRFC